MALSFWIPLRPISGSIEPLHACRDGNIVWEEVAYQASGVKINGKTATNWQASTEYKVGDIVNISTQSMTINSFSLQCKEIVNDYLMEFSTKQELHQIVTSIADYLHGLALGPSAEKYKALAQYGTDVVCKHKDIGALSEQALIALITENGYAYLTDLLALSKTQLQNVVYYLPLIQALKGTLPGLELMLATFCDKVAITEWWDSDKDMQAYTFDLNVIRLKNITVTSDMQSIIAKFCGEYVYPLLNEIEIHVTFADETDSNKIFCCCDIINQVTLLIDTESKPIKPSSGTTASDLGTGKLIE